jgi:3-phenylpropionate/trans-cinnamate dioxygenase ferredoxin reductase component
VLVRARQVVIAGAGLAGLRTAQELRARGYPGEITMIGAEDRPPYDRPPLTKAFMAGALEDTTLDADFAALRVTFRPGETAAAVEGGVLRTDRGQHTFGVLVVATGAAPVRLPGPGPQRVLRTAQDALSVRAALRPGVRLAIVGAGWIGAELATAAAARGCQVTVLEAASAPLAAALGTEVGTRTLRWYSGAGVDLRLGQPVESVQAGGLALPGGGWLAADVVVTAVGVRPAVSWLSGSGVRLDNGVAVDRHLRGSLPGVYAVGDCAAFESRRYGRRIRVEHWDAALHAPEVAAANIVGGEVEYDPVPYFWSEQFGRMVQYAGHHAGGDQLVWRGDPASGGWSACWLACGGASAPTGPRLAAVLAVGRPRDLLQGRRLIASGQPVDAGKVADPAVPLRAALATPR